MELMHPHTKVDVVEVVREANASEIGRAHV